MRKYQPDFALSLIFVTNPKWPGDPRATKGVPLSQRVKEIMREQVARTDEEMVFLSTMCRGRNLSKSVIIRVFNEACEKA